MMKFSIIMYQMVVVCYINHIDLNSILISHLILVLLKIIVYFTAYRALFKNMYKNKRTEKILCSS